MRSLFRKKPRATAAFERADDIVKYVEGALESAAPQGWAWKRDERKPLTWLVRKTDIRPGEWHLQEYSLHACREIRVFALTAFGLDALLRLAFARCPPNEWGYT